MGRWAGGLRTGRPRRPSPPTALSAWLLAVALTTLASGAEGAGLDGGAVHHGANELLQKAAVQAAPANDSKILEPWWSDEPGMCNVPHGLDQGQLSGLWQRNCRKVMRAVQEYRAATNTYGSAVSKAQAQEWQTKAAQAEVLCHKASAAGDNLTAARLAVHAWGYEVMDGSECCIAVNPPYLCVESKMSQSSYILIFAGVGLVLMFVGTMVVSCFLRAEIRQPEAQPVAPLPVEGGPPANLRVELQEKWMGGHHERGSPLRVLPGAQAVARSSAGVFGALHEKFDFQADNVRNQYEHLLSLLRSHVASVADRDIEAVVSVDESERLLLEALGDLHVDLLEGFLKWRQRYYDEDSTGFVEREADELPPLGGAAWDHIPDALCHGHVGTKDTAKQLSVCLAEIATYLVVWGEAGNVRFMPEVIYFITELALAADPVVKPAGLYGGATPAGGAPGKAGHRSGNFLAQVIRPIYHVIANEWYEEIDIDAKSGRAVRRHHAGYDAYLPPDAANYDDWDELFCDPERVARRLVLRDENGDERTHLCDLPHGQRFAALFRVDWPASLDAAAVKTHREVHSLWGVYAATNRVFLLHCVMFFFGICLVTGNPGLREGQVPLVPMGGSTAAVRVAAIGLLAPLHAMVWSFARWETTSHAALDLQSGRVCFWGVLSMMPLFTYAWIRWIEASLSVHDEQKGQVKLTPEGTMWLFVAICCHYAISGFVLAQQLFCPARPGDRKWKLTSVPLRFRFIRYFFWFSICVVKLVLGSVVCKAVFEAEVSLNFVSLARTSSTELRSAWGSAQWGMQVLEWLLLWFTTFFIYFSDTGMFHALGCTILGAVTVLVQRKCKVLHYALEDAISKIPERFSDKVFTYTLSLKALKGHSAQHSKRLGLKSAQDDSVAAFSPYFPMIWDRIIEYMRYEDKCDNQGIGDLSFDAGDGGRAVGWEQLTDSLRHNRSSARNGSSAAFVDEEKVRVKVPEMFRGNFPIEIAMKHYCCIPDPTWITNAEAQWRFIALSRGLGLPMPRPFRAPYIPGITVFIPFLGGKERVIELKETLFHGRSTDTATQRTWSHRCRPGRDRTVPLIDWLATKYRDEFRAFTSRMEAAGAPEWPSAGSQWEEYTEAQWEKICCWASMRLQTLWRTVAGMTLYHQALQVHYEVQADRMSRLAHADIWDPSDCFTCLIAMQCYKVFNAKEIKDVNKMFDKFPSCLKVALTDWEERNENGEADNMHPRQKRRYYSGMIDATSPSLPNGQRVPRLRVELPGCYLLGDGKNEAQNFAIPYTRGAFIQCMDMNQGAYFEQMLLLPSVLGEFRSRYRGDARAKKIIGLPEHITSDIGSVGSFAAGAEVAFGTMLQRSYAVLGARMHYGHPDIMNKQYMMQQGGVSKATKTLNLSEDIFAGMDFTLRGDGRTIQHCEYFHLAKGRDLGFNAVIGFFSKLSSGTGEQILTRQMLRLHHVFQLPECLSFWYAHGGFYMTECLVSWSVPIMVTMWLLVLCADCDPDFQAFRDCPERPAGEVMAKLLSVCFSWLLLLFIVAKSMPLFVELWMERSFRIACETIIKQYLTGSWLLFSFQAKVIGSYILNEIRYGGATYVATGRSLPTQRIAFIGAAAGHATTGLYLDYATHTFYDAIMLLFLTCLIPAAGGTPAGSSRPLAFTWLSVWLTICSWLFAPFLFNPYQFRLRDFKEDIKNWWLFFFGERAMHWTSWYERKQLGTRKGFRHSVVDPNFCLVCFFLAAWLSVMSVKLWLVRTVFNMSYPTSFSILQAAGMMPPVGFSFLYCVVATLVSSLCGRSPPAEPSPQGGGASGSGGRTSTDESSGDEAPPCAAFCPVPLPVSALVVFVLEVLEGAAPLYGPGGALFRVSFRKTMVTGLVVKVFLLELVLFLAEGALTSRCFARSSWLGRCLQHFVHANRLARDLLTSVILLVCLALGLPLYLANEMACPGCNVHHLCLYRDPGHLERTEAQIVDFATAKAATPLHTTGGSRTNFGDSLSLYSEGQDGPFGDGGGSDFGSRLGGTEEEGSDADSTGSAVDDASAPSAETGALLPRKT